jgi:hypothetical protein
VPKPDTLAARRSYGSLAAQKRAAMSYSGVPALQPRN